MAASSSTAAASSMSGANGGGGGGSVFPGPPPPTPSNHHHALPSSGAAGGGTDAALSTILQRLLLSSPAPILRSPLSSRSRAPPSLPPLVSLGSSGTLRLDAAADVGYFHLEGHGVPSQLPSSALAELSLVDASARRASNLLTLGFTEEDQQEADGAEDPALVFDVDDEGEMGALPAAAAEYARRMRDVGMQVVAMMSGCPEVGFGEAPFAEGRRKARCLMWVSKVAAGEAAPPAAGKAKAYPYVVGIHCQWEASGKEAAPASWVMDDGGEWTAVGARDGALLVTIGDIAQVWSNGKLKKVRGMARPVSSAPGAGHGAEADRLSVTVLITLPLDSVISPLVPVTDAGEEGGDDDVDGAGDDGDGWRFHSFLLEDLAWRVYNGRLQFKDPLVRYRI
ncbi:gibberellin 2-beta-dioxygenase 6 [Oryza glaberrima]|uniref:Isopenicillin N synthase-like Fe(2+) 2OG dioxygenase domain-containing protein n=1 Tax=Oryza glaberrima TaxID=4538 RepID=I1NT02_ORYGL|nr:gibberellin 2-beta-dioxygenase 6 [Oryza glaberrima]